jgi:hypothetical protein
LVFSQAVAFQQEIGQPKQIAPREHAYVMAARYIVPARSSRTKIGSYFAMKKSVIAAAAILASLGCATADDVPTIQEIDALPYAKAWSYAVAAEQYCFVPKDTLAKSGPLLDAYGWQMLITDLLGYEPDNHRIYEAAEAHLRGDQSACTPAIKFVRQTDAQAAAGEADRLFNLLEHLRAMGYKDSTERNKAAQTRGQ